MGLKTVQLRGLTVPKEVKDLVDVKLLKRYSVFHSYKIIIKNTYLINK